jgi:acyl dehydratase
MSELVTGRLIEPRVERRVGPITRTQIVRFAGAGGDFNPIHHDEEFARSAGQPTVFAMGQLQAAILAHLAAEWLGAGELRSLSVRFTAKVWPGDELILRGAIESETVVDSERRVVATLEALREDDEVVARGTVTACYQSSEATVAEAVA